MSRLSRQRGERWETLLPAVRIHYEWRAAAALPNAVSDMIAEGGKVLAADDAPRVIPSSE